MQLRRLWFGPRISRGLAFEIPKRQGQQVEKPQTAAQAGSAGKRRREQKGKLSRWEIFILADRNIPLNYKSAVTQKLASPSQTRHTMSPIQTFG